MGRDQVIDRMERGPVVQREGMPVDRQAGRRQPPAPGPKRLVLSWGDAGIRGQGALAAAALKLGGGASLGG